MKTKEKIITGLILVLFLAASVASLWLIDDVDINYNLSDYLQEDTDTKQALHIIEDSFGMSTDLKVMISNIPREQAAQTADILSEIDNVLAVTFDPDNEDCYKDNAALYTLLIDGDEYSQAAIDVISDVKSTPEPEYDDIHYSGTAMEKQVLRASITSEMVWILGIALALVVAILVITAGSWMEPVVLLLSSGVAVLLNMGSNLLLGEISYITNSVAAILQLALSIDYSIVLLHTYRTMLSNREPGFATMLQTEKAILRPVSASGLTTMAGLVALLFMSFRIGFDIGIVLLKGIMISLITSVVFFPALLLMFEPLMQKTKKRSFVPSGKPFSKLAIRHGSIVIPIFLVILIACSVLQNSISYTFSDAQGSDPLIEETFGQNNTVILVYDSSEQEMEEEYIQRISALTKSDGSPVLLSATGYSNTILEEYDLNKAQEALGLSEEDVRLLYTMYAMDSKADTVVMRPTEFALYAQSLLETDENAATIADENTTSALNSLLSAKALMENQNTAQEFLDGLSQCLPGDSNTVTPEVIDQLYLLYFSHLGNDTEDTIKGIDFVDYVISVCETTPQLAAQFPEDMHSGLYDLRSIHEFFQDETAYTYTELFDRFRDFGSSLATTTVELSQTHLKGIYIKYAAEHHTELIAPISAQDLLTFVSDSMDSNPLLTSVMTEEDHQKVLDAEETLQRAEDMFCSENYNRIMLSLDLKTEGYDTESFMLSANSIADEVFTGEAYLAGTIPSTYDLIQSFDHDNMLISLFTIISIFLIVMILFRSLSIPTLLVLVIQGAIWLAMAIMGLTNTPIFFMSYIMATCILMGATIDYGVLMSSNYTALRKNMDRDEALSQAIDSAMPTVFNSGMILVIAGFVIAFVSSQQAISTAGLLIGVGAAASTGFITLVLPSLLHRLDKFILKLTLK